MAAVALPRAAAPGHRPSVAAAASASRLRLGQRHFLASSASRFAAVSRPRLSVVAMADKYPIIGVDIKPRDKADAEKMANGLVKLAHEDALFQFSIDDDYELAFIKGMGESQLDTIVDRLKREFKVEVNVGDPQVIYRETVSKIVESQCVYKEGVGTFSRFADVTLRLEPMEAGSGYEFKSEIKEGAMRNLYVKGVMKGIKNCLSNGALAFGSSDMHSSFLTFQTAAGIAFRQALIKDGPGVLEPAMRVEVITPEEHYNDVVYRLVCNRGHLESVEDKPGGLQVIDAFVPLAGMIMFQHAECFVQGERVVHDEARQAHRCPTGYPEQADL